jgi:hypothetical protein
MSATEKVSGEDARELLVSNLSNLGRNRYNVVEGVRVSPAQCHFRAELMARDAFDLVGESYDRPTLTGVLEAAENIARQEAITHPGLTAQLGHLTSYIMQKAYV